MLIMNNYVASVIEDQSRDKDNHGYDVFTSSDINDNGIIQII